MPPSTSHAVAPPNTPERPRARAGKVYRIREDDAGRWRVISDDGDVDGLFVSRGSIDVESEPGVRTCFTLHLPRIA